VIFRINNRLIDTDTYEVRRGDGVASIEPQVLDLLILLVENRHRLVSKQEIMERIWKSRAVSDTALSSRMKSARQAIGDSGASQALIRTIRGRGFRFVAEVSEIGEETDRAARAGVVDAAGCDAPIRPNEGKNEDTEFGPLANSLEAGEGLDRALPRQPSVAVLPFVALGDEPQHQILADGLTLDLITRLSRMRWLSVIDRGTAFTMRRSSAGARDIGRVLGVRYIARGSARFFGKRLRVSAALTEVSGPAEIWADQFDCSIDDIFAVQDQVSGRRQRRRQRDRVRGAAACAPDPVGKVGCLDRISPRMLAHVPLHPTGL
jgi:TolB-like protein/DNA-binding winged helix-turn-helix (wHTH) protein